MLQCLSNGSTSEPPPKSNNGFARALDDWRLAAGRIPLSTKPWLFSRALSLLGHYNPDTVSILQVASLRSREGLKSTLPSLTCSAPCATSSVCIPLAVLSNPPCYRGTPIGGFVDAPLTAKGQMVEDQRHEQLHSHHRRPSRRDYLAQ